MTIVKHLVVAMMSSVFTALLIFFVMIMLDQTRDRTPPVAISDMLAEAAMGRIEEITVTGTRYEYRIKGADEQYAKRVAHGPKTTAAELAAFVGKTKIDVR